ncbi:MAG: ADP/ATP carrier protein [Chrysothrix sp. TS-e1954]|nr:MAG: ADP/ATP carrier protein [Chrysothrix sp. TS-e1954]
MPVQKEALLPSWGLALAGATGAVGANAIVYPLDIVKTRLQVQVRKRDTSTSPANPLAPQKLEDHHYESTLHAISKIMEDEGLAGLYHGISSSLVGVASTNFAYFYWYSIVRTLYLKSTPQSLNTSTPVELSLGAVAGALAQLFTIPISVVTTRQQMQRRSERKGLSDTTREILNSEDGVSGLWRGLKASLVLVVNPSITYGAYQRLKDIIFPGKTNLRPWEAFFLGACSKSLATLVTQPLIVAKVRLQSKPPPERNGKPFKTFNEVLAYTIEHEGILSLFKGIGPQLLKGLLVQGLLMMFKERVELLFIVLFTYVRQIRADRLKKAAEAAAQKVKEASPVMLK